MINNKQTEEKLERTEMTISNIKINHITEMKMTVIKIKEDKPNNLISDRTEENIEDKIEERRINKTKYMIEDNTRETRENMIEDMIEERRENKTGGRFEDKTEERRKDKIVEMMYLNRTKEEEDIMIEVNR